MAKVLGKCQLIVLDECTMTHNKFLEALDRTIKALWNNQNRFGGIGNLRQTLPVIPRTMPVHELNAC